MKLGIKLKAGDYLLMAAIFVLALLLFVLPLLSPKAAWGEIVLAQTGQVRQVSLAADSTYEVCSNGITLTVEVKDGEIFIAHSDCRDGICKNTPPISRAGQSIVCAPAGVVVRITGEEAVVDGVAG